MAIHKYKRALYILILFLGGILIYANAVHAPFEFDDDLRITFNDAVHMDKFDTASLKRAVLESPTKSRPVPYISFAINYYFGGLSPSGYHWVNIIIHNLCAIFLFFFFLDTLFLYSAFNKGEGKVSSCEYKFQINDNAASLVAFFAALLWLTHPVNTSAVTYIIQRITSMAAMFYIFSLMCYVKGRISQKAAGHLTLRAKILFSGAILSGLLALASKQNTATLPIFILLFEWIFFRKFRPLPKKTIIYSAFPVIIIISIAGLYYMGGNPIEFLSNWYANQYFNLNQRLMTELRVVFYYISLFFFPAAVRLNLDYDYPLSLSLFDPAATLLAFAAIIALIVLAIYQPKRHLILFFTIIWFIGNLIIESTIIPLAIIYEHRTYLPFMMPCLLISFYAYHLFKKSSWAYIGILIVAVLLLGTETYQRNKIWQDAVVFAKDGVIKAPNKFRPWSNLAINFKKQGMTEEAVATFRKALEMEPKTPDAKLQKAHTYKYLGDALMKKEELESAIESYSQALDLIPDYRDVILKIAIAKLKQKKPQATIDFITSYLPKDFKDAEIRITMGNAYYQLHQLQKAADHFKKALASKPVPVIAHYKLGNILVQMGKLKEAIAHFEQTIQMAPNFPNAYVNLGNALAQKGQFNEAIANYKKALAIDPNYKKARENLQKVRAYLKNNAF